MGLVNDERNKLLIRLVFLILITFLVSCASNSKYELSRTYNPNAAFGPVWDEGTWRNSSFEMAR